MRRMPLLTLVSPVVMALFLLVMERFEARMFPARSEEVSSPHVEATPDPLPEPRTPVLGTPASLVA